MNTLFRLFLFVMIGCSVVACTEKAPTYLKPYYFPLDDLAEGQVYEYRATGEGAETDPPYYWYYRSVEQEDGLYLAGMFYNHLYTPTQMARESVVENGIVLEDYFLFDDSLDSLQKQVPAEVLEPSVFPFTTSGIGSVYVYSIRYAMPSDSGAVTTLYRNRQYMGDTTVVFRGEEYHAIQFYVRELIDIEQEGHTEHEFDGLEIYAKGVGLVYTRKNISESFVLQYELHDIYSMDVLEEKFRSQPED